MMYLAWDREINILLFFFCDVFVWKWGPRPRTSSRCYHGKKSAATSKKGIFVHPPPRVPNCMQNLKGGWKYSFPKMFDSYRDLLKLPVISRSRSPYYVKSSYFACSRGYKPGLFQFDSQGCPNKFRANIQAKTWLMVVEKSLTKLETLRDGFDIFTFHTQFW